MSTEVLERSFPVSGKALLKLSNIAGSVTLQPGDDGLIMVSATKHLETGSGSRTEIQMEQDGSGQVTVATRHPEGLLGILSLSRPCEVDYLVRLPRACEVKVSGVSSRIQAAELEGQLDLSTVSGEISIHSLSGSLAVSSVSGNIQGAGINGGLHLKTVSGDVRLSQAELSRLEASTVSGSIQLQSSLGQGPYRFNSVSGDVSMELPKGAACRVELRSVSGDLQIERPVTRRSKSGGTQQVEIGSGGPSISVSSISGNVSILGANGASLGAQPSFQQESAPKSSSSAADLSPEERLAILEKINNGEITVEEGLRILQGQ